MLFASRSVIFDEFRFIVPTLELLRIGSDGSSIPIPLGTRAAEILHLLLQRHGELVSKDEIMDAVWPDMAIQDNNLTVQVAALRRALDDGRDGGSCIQTVPGRGYRFNLRVVEDGGPEPSRSVAGTPTADGPDLLPDAHRPSPQSMSAASAPTYAGGKGPGNWRLHGGVIGFLCAALIAYGWQGPSVPPPHAGEGRVGATPTRPTEPPRLSIVVLPFTNASGTPKEDELAA
jgi:DNA-binding winged helix-turn-helix (wHTH) protein